LAAITRWISASDGPAAGSVAHSRHVRQRSEQRSVTIHVSLKGSKGARRARRTAASSAT
jgi:hypothetical protein